MNACEIQNAYLVLADARTHLVAATRAAQLTKKAVKDGERQARKEGKITGSNDTARADCLKELLAELYAAQEAAEANESLADFEFHTALDIVEMQGRLLEIEKLAAGAPKPGELDGKAAGILNELCAFLDCPWDQAADRIKQERDAYNQLLNTIQVLEAKTVDLEAEVQKMAGEMAVYQQREAEREQVEDQRFEDCQNYNQTIEAGLNPRE